MTIQSRKPARSAPDANNLSPRVSSIYSVLLASVGRTRFCTPLKSLLTRGDDE